jgi:hypothetical protein
MLICHPVEEISHCTLRILLQWMRCPRYSSGLVSADLVNLSLERLPATAVNVRVNALSLSSRPSKSIGGSSNVRSVSVVFIMPETQPPFTALVKEEAR